LSCIECLSCTICNAEFRPGEVLELCPKCGGILDPKYDLEKIVETTSREEIGKRVPNTMWRWLEFLPITDQRNIVSAFEGGTPLAKMRRLGQEVGMTDLYVKDETKNPTLTFKDRGASATISKLKELGVGEIGVSSEGNAACAFALYSQMAGIICHAYIPVDANPTKRELLLSLGADLHLVKGTIADAGKQASEDIEKHGWYNAATFVTPYRHDGKGTMVMEILETLKWKSPDVLVYPTGGGVGIVGMWKAVKAFEKLDWIQNLPRIIAVQPENCAPVVEAFLEGRDEVEEWKDPQTVAMGLRVPKPLAGTLILNALRESKGSAIKVSEEQIISEQRSVLRLEGLILEPSSSAAFAALPSMIEEGIVDSSEKVVILATGSGHKTLEYFVR
jgi:threonine synthase